MKAESVLRQLQEGVSSWLLVLNYQFLTISRISNLRSGALGDSSIPSALSSSACSQMLFLYQPSHILYLSGSWVQGRGHRRYKVDQIEMYDTDSGMWTKHWRKRHYFFAYLLRFMGNSTTLFVWLLHKLRALREVPWVALIIIWSNWSRPVAEAECKSQKLAVPC